MAAAAAEAFFDDAAVALANDAEIGRFREEDERTAAASKAERTKLLQEKAALKELSDLPPNPKPFSDFVYAPDVAKQLNMYASHSIVNGRAPTPDKLGGGRGAGGGVAASMLHEAVANGWGQGASKARAACKKPSELGKGGEFGSVYAEAKDTVLRKTYKNTVAEQLNQFRVFVPDPVPRSEGWVVAPEGHARSVKDAKAKSKKRARRRIGSGGDGALGSALGSAGARSLMSPGPSISARDPPPLPSRAGGTTDAAPRRSALSRGGTASGAAKSVKWGGAFLGSGALPGGAGAGGGHYRVSSRGSSRNARVSTAGDAASTVEDPLVGTALGGQPPAGLPKMPGIGPKAHLFLYEDADEKWEKKLEGSSVSKMLGSRWERLNASGETVEVSDSPKKGPNPYLDGRPDNSMIDDFYAQRAVDRIEHAVLLAQQEQQAQRAGKEKKRSKRNKSADPPPFSPVARRATEGQSRFQLEEAAPVQATSIRGRREEDAAASAQDEQSVTAFEGENAAAETAHAARGGTEYEERKLKRKQQREARETEAAEKAAAEEASRVEKSKREMKIGEAISSRIGMLYEWRMRRKHGKDYGKRGTDTTKADRRESELWSRAGAGDSYGVRRGLSKKGANPMCVREGRSVFLNAFATCLNNELLGRKPAATRAGGMRMFTPNYDKVMEALVAACDEGDGDVSNVPALLDYVEERGVRDNEGWAAIHLAARLGRKERLEWLLEAGASIDLLTIGGETALMHASSKAQLDCIVVLLRRGANPNLVDVRGWNALHHAARSGGKTVCSCLLNAGVKKDAVDEEGRRPDELALQCPVPKKTTAELIRKFKFVDKERAPLLNYIDKHVYIDGQGPSLDSLGLAGPRSFDDLSEDGEGDDNND